MNILIVSQFFYPEMGAAPVRLTNIAKALVNDGANVEVLTALPNYPYGKIAKEYRGKFYAKDNFDGIIIHRYWLLATKSINKFIRLFALVSLALSMLCFAFKRRTIKKYDLVLVQTPPLFCALSAIFMFKKIYHKRLVLNISDIHPESLIGLGVMQSNSMQYKLLLRIQNFTYRNADLFIGQSHEIVRHIKAKRSDAPLFLYRNLQRSIDANNIKKNKNNPLRLVYAGLFSLPQGIATIVKSIDYKKLGVELHLYGEGADVEEVKKYIEKEDTNVFYHGVFGKNEMTQELSKYDASIVPLMMKLEGAVPSKIFDLIAVGKPILYIGGKGEAADIITDNKIGFVAEVGQFEQLSKNILKLKSISSEEYAAMVERCIQLSENEYNFNNQFSRFREFLNI
ncbi:MAG: glycosyltransferase family 4 protein [Prevotellaceae bacterium]|jgi:glycosyltransferase involved in cell wall biosynthesis|nr:glycosyltransferase family 4 protein [Prevotellaceae bacterium]